MWLKRVFACLMMCAILICGPALGQAQSDASSNLVADAATLSDTLTEVQTGIYVLRLTNVSPRDGSFDADFWIWFRWQGSDVRPDQTFELANGVIASRSDTEVLNDNGYNYAAVRVQGTIYHEFDVRQFPLDDHTLTIEIEDAEREATNLVYVVDPGTELDPKVDVAGWQVGLGRPATDIHAYPTNYGFQSSGEVEAKYSRFSVPITLERTSIAPLFKLFWISLLSVVLGLLAFKVKSDDLDARFGMGVGSIFAASANAFVISDSLPETTHITLAEQINLIAVGAIFLTVFISIWSLRLRYADRDEASVRLDNWSLLIISALYVALNAVVMLFNLI
ncbi:hypothetical protein OEW28_06705 [Defluviimonas sp. WL0002]|uniref:Neurotransmitter-gated ion-channel ligand-binding domain-containing protein n=1 Tax=Albidovulum marisflavi TaxID=2984159 RepID=A0ABT2ZB72_9RHOB|nr:hypothetical protein [Defluviimonas sp. WL0002]MCV2868315.1 hypothetical protein [Defluviimonas sp. WL0002]